MGLKTQLRCPGRYSLLQLKITTTKGPTSPTPPAPLGADNVMLRASEGMLPQALRSKSLDLSLTTVQDAHPSTIQGEGDLCARPSLSPL